MARMLNRLRTRQVETLGPGRHSDGGGLYLDRDAQGRSRWIFMWTRGGRRREMGLGPANRDGVSLANARAAAAKARQFLASGRDPIEERNAERAPPARVPTFGEVAEEYVRAQSPQWRNAKHRAQWSTTLGVYAKPLWDVPVDRVSTTGVLAVLQPIWLTKPETATRLRGRIERVLHAAKVQGHRDGVNPATWRGHLDHLLPARRKLSRGHHAALHFTKVPGFVGELRQREGVAALALEFLILTAARTGEVLGATWKEIDLGAKVWVVPATRMKADREHRVPLCARALAILRQVQPLRSEAELEGDLIFPGQKIGKPLSGMAFAKVLGRMGYDVTVHGFRSSFRDWAGEVSPFPREIAEAALAHNVGDATERAYRRGDALDKRRRLMDAWVKYIETAPRGTLLQFPGSDQSRSKTQRHA